MDQDIYIVSRSGGEWEDHYTLPLFYVTSQEEGDRLANKAKAEWLSAVERFPMPEDKERPADPNDWTEAEWHAYHEAAEAEIAATLNARLGCLTVDLAAPIEDGDIPSYGVRKLSSRSIFIRDQNKA